MNQYLLSVFEVAGQGEDTSPTPEEMRAFMGRVIALEEEMDRAGAFAFGGALHGPDAATVVRGGTGLDKVTTDGPFVEAKEQIGGFYIVNAEASTRRWRGRPRLSRRSTTTSRFGRSGRLGGWRLALATDGAGRMNDIERAFREAHGQAVATLTRIFGDLTLAEDAVQDAFVAAVASWPIDGVPDNPAGWIVTTARNRAVDVVRRSRRGRQLTEQVATDWLRVEGTAGQDESIQLPDDQLRLIFTCCHPALRVEHQVALTLRLVAGLSPVEVASAFLVSEEAMAKRLVRAKYKIKAANIAYRVPAADDLPRRLRAVLTVLYLIYNAGADDTSRRGLRAEAIWLTRVLVGLMPDAPEAAGLLALMLLSDARMPARSDVAQVMLLQDQDRSLWDSSMIAEGQALVLACLRHRSLGPFQLQAAIQALHCAALRYEETDWAAIVRFYDRLIAVMPTPVVMMNRAIAVAETDGPEASLALLDELQQDLDEYHLLHASRAAMLERMGHPGEAADAYHRAAALARTDADISFLTQRHHGLPTASSEPAC